MSNSDTDDSYDGQQISDDDDTYTGPNKIQELVEDNTSLRETLNHATKNLSEKHNQIEAFYQKLKVSAKLMATAYKQKQSQVDSMEKTIALLRADNFTLNQKVARIGIEGMTIDSSEANGIAGNDKEYEETVISALSDALKRAEAELLANQEYMDEKWRTQQQKFNEEYKAGLQNFERYYQHKMEEQQAAHDADKKKYEEQTKMCQAQVCQLIKELQDNKNINLILEDTISKYKNNSQLSEARIYQQSKDFETSKEKNRSMEEDIIRLKQEYEEIQRQKSGKEKSLDELFDVYNREHDEKEKLQQELDKYIARYLCAEESLKHKTNEGAPWMRRIETAEAERLLFKQQADIYKNDFEMEREERQRKHNECDNLKTMVGKYQIEMQKMKQEIIRHQERDRAGYGAPYGHG